MKVNCADFCSLDCKIEQIKFDQTRPLDDFDFQVLKKQKGEGWNRDKLKEFFNVPISFLERLEKRAAKHLTDTQLKNLYLD